MIPIIAGVVTGVAAWCTRASFDMIGTDDHPIRLAMLPSLAEGMIWVVACVAISWMAATLTTRFHNTAGTSTDAANDALLPLLATGVLVLPYLPYLPDAWRALTVLAGPVKYIVWVVAFVLVGRALFIHLEGRLAVARGVSPGKMLPIVAIVSAAVFAVAATRAIGSVVPGGDEPHYLIIAQSFWRDGDLRIENNHQQGQILEHYPRDLAPDYLARGVDGEIYSVHPIGLSVLAAPVYAVGGYRGVVGFMVLTAVVAAVVMWRLAYQLTGSRSAATFAWLACALSAPFVFNGFTIYPEMFCGALAVIVYQRVAVHETRHSAVDWLACGCALAAMPWLGTKYVLMAGVLGLVALGRLWWPSQSLDERDVAAGTRFKYTIALTAPCGVSLAAWVAFFWVIWGTPSPSAPYGSFRTTDIATLLRGLPGLLFDQEYGIVAVAPVLWLAIMGLVAMARDQEARREAIEIGATALALLVLVGSFNLWWGGSAMVGRPTVAMLPLLSVPVAWRYEQQRGAPAVRAAYVAILAVSLMITATLSTVYRGLLLAADKDGASKLLEWWSGSSWDLTAVAPTFIRDSPDVAAGFTLTWLSIVCAAGFLLRRITSSTGPGRAGLVAAAVAGIGTAVASVSVPVMFGERRANSAKLEGRSESRLLDDFSPSRRPIAVRYDAFHRIDPARVPQAFQFVARFGQARPTTPVPLLYDARWSLPPGRYRVEVIAATSATPPDSALSLQLGRLGEPVETWPVSLDSRGRWSHPIDVDVYVETFGFRATPALAALKPTLVIHPGAVFDRAAEPARRSVLQVAQYGPTRVYFHDDRTYPEPTGFWTGGGQTSWFTFASRTSTPPQLRLRAGPIATSVRVSWPGFAQQFRLEANELRVLALPSTATGVWPAAIETTEPFVPARVDPQSRDQRRLGCWIEVVPGTDG
jgi:hypothetical protein